MKPLTLWNDPIIAELHAVRAQLLKAAGGDMHQLVVNARKAAAQARRLPSQSAQPKRAHVVAA